MNEVRVLVQGTARDLAAFSAFMKSEAAFIEENEPGTRLMEIFGDESSGQWSCTSSTWMQMPSWITQRA